MRFILKSFLLFLLSFNAISHDICVESLTEGSIYDILPLEDNKIYEGRLEKVVKLPGDKFQLIFSKKNDKTITEVFDLGVIRELSKQKPERGKIFIKGVELFANFLSFLSVQKGHRDSLVIPYSVLETTGSVKVVGLPGGSKKRAQNIKKAIVEIDSYFHKIKFKLPSSTRVILNDINPLPNLVGPVSYGSGFFNLSLHKWGDLMRLSPFLYDKKIIDQPNIVMHERVHGVMRRNYMPGALINKNEFIAEGFADFITCHYLDDPKFGSLRNISTLETNLGEKMNSLLDVSVSYAHFNSMLISNFLWELRKKIGGEKIDALLPNLIDALNDHAMGLPLYTFKKRNHFIEYMEYFLAVVIKVSESDPSGKTIKIFLDEYYKKWSFNKNLVEKKSQKLEKFEISSRIKNDKKVRTIDIIKIYGTAGLMYLPEAVITYFLLF